MQYNEFTNRLKKIFPKLKISTLYQAAGLFGHAPYDKFQCFLKCGASSRVQIILKLLEAIPEKELHQLFEDNQ